MADISAGAQIDSRSSNGINRVTRIETISDGMIDYNHIGWTDKKIDSHYKLELNDILYSNINSLNHIGKSAIIQNLPYPLYHGMNLLRISSKIDSLFLFYSLNTSKHKLWAMSHANQAVSQASINQTTLSKQLFSIPVKIEQLNVGRLLKCLDQTITLHEEKKRQLELLKSALLQKMFANKNGYPAVRFEEFDKAWKQSKLGEITKVIASKPYISTPSAHGNYLVIQQGDKPIAGFSNSNPFKDYNNITLFGDHTLSLFKPRSPFLVASDGIKILSPSIEMNGLFYFYELEKYKPKSEGYKRHFTILKKCKTNFPTDIDEQKLIGSLLLRVDNLIAKQQLKMDKLNETKESLLQSMFI